ncbi:Protein-lysine N-methyltransferase [Sergentomyia squamirostris]
MSEEVESGELDGSELGTKEFWDRSYEIEIRNYKSHGDVGEIWFDEDSQARVITWILKSDEISSNDKILDIGCGNGLILVELAQEGFNQLTGVDYSHQAIELAKSIAMDRKIDTITYHTVDILSPDEAEKLGKFQIIHDKGTYDAICLCPEDPTTKRKKYLENVYKLLNDNGIFIITSCNWTEGELIDSFKEKFTVKQIIPTPAYKFAGKVGNVVTSIVFSKKL